MAEFDIVTGLGYGIITFAMVIGVGLIVLSKFGGAVSECPTGYTWNNNGTLDMGVDACCNSTGAYNCVGANTTDGSEGSQSAVYMMTQVGEDGLASWTPAIVALVVGMLFLGMFLTRGKRV